MAKLRESTGGAFESRGKFFMRVTVAPGARRPKLLPWAGSLEEAQARAHDVQALVNRLRVADEGDLSFLENLVERTAVADPNKMAAITRQVDALLVGEKERGPEPATKGGPMTIRKFGERWTSGELHTEFPDHVDEKRTADDDEKRLGKWVYPVVGDVPITSFTLPQAHEVMRRIPKTKSASTRRHVAQLLVRIFNLAVYPCAIIKASPLPRGFLPKLGSGKALAWLYPEDDAKLMACVGDATKDEPGVPLANRMIYGFLAREGMRSDEAQRLQWRDVDLARGTVRLDENKTDSPRTWTLNPDVADALETWKAMHKGAKVDDLVFPGIVKPYSLAAMLRDHLKLAKVDRPELFERTKARGQIRVHDLRATFVTLSLAADRTETWVMDRTGHTTSGQLQNYRRAARTAAELDLGELAPMFEAIPEIAAAFAAAGRGCRREKRDAVIAANAAESAKFRRMDSNHNKRIQNPLSCH